MNISVGESEMTLGGRRFILRPCFRAFAAIEGATKKSMSRLFDELSDSEGRFADMALMIHFMIEERTKGASPGIEAVGELVFEGEYFVISHQLQAIIASVLVKSKEKKTTESAQTPNPNASTGTPSSALP